MCAAARATQPRGGRECRTSERTELAPRSPTVPSGRRHYQPRTGLVRVSPPPIRFSLLVHRSLRHRGTSQRPMTFIKLNRLALTVLALVVTQSVGSIRGQSPDGTPEYRMLLTSERALSFVLAADRKLDYVPGEVLVKFHDGVSVGAQQRALAALRSRPSPSALHWVGEVALLTDRTEPDAARLAAQLQAQPEVAYAEPNYLYRVHATPNDPGFAERQWNFTALDMARAWDINPGGNESIVVSVIDTGVTSVSRSFSFPTWNGRTLQNVLVPFGANPDFSANRIVTSKDFVFWDGPVLDMEGHGTHVASTIGEDTNNALAEAGIAYKVKLMPLKVCVEIGRAHV